MENELPKGEETKATSSEALPKHEEVTGDALPDKLMRLVLSLRAELYDLYAKHQALLDENNRLRATKIVTHRLKEEPKAEPQEAERVVLPTTEGSSP
jgi:hypothetical protein